MVANGPPFRLLPRLDDTNRFFWTSGKDGQLRFLKCEECETFVHPPAPVCPKCLSRTLSPETVSGSGTLSSFTVNTQQWIPGSDLYVVAWVTIDEQDDVRLTTNLIDVEPDQVEIGMKVQVVFEAADDEVFLPLFRPQSKAK